MARVSAADEGRAGDSGLDDFPHDPPQPATLELFGESLAFAKATSEVYCCDWYSRLTSQSGTES